MNWEKLKENKCPKCSELLKQDGLLGNHKCECGFQISPKKFDKIVNDLYKPRPKRCMTFEKNLEALNNLGRKEVTEDFSDSPHLL